VAFCLIRFVCVWSTESFFDVIFYHLVLSFEGKKMLIVSPFPPLTLTHTVPKRKVSPNLKLPVQTLDDTLKTASSIEENTTLAAPQVRRILKELTQLKKNAHPGFDIFPCQSNIGTTSLFFNKDVKLHKLKEEEAKKKNCETSHCAVQTTFTMHTQNDSTSKKHKNTQRTPIARSPFVIFF